MPSMPSSARSGAGLRGGGADRHDRGPARVSALCGADLSPRLVLRAVGEPGAGFGLVANVVGGGVAEGGLGAGRRASYRWLRPTRDLSAAGDGRGPPSPPGTGSRRPGRDDGRWRYHGTLNRLNSAHGQHPHPHRIRISPQRPGQSLERGPGALLPGVPRPAVSSDPCRDRLACAVSFARQ